MTPTHLQRQDLLKKHVPQINTTTTKHSTLLKDSYEIKCFLFIEFSLAYLRI